MNEENSSVRSYIRSHIDSLRSSAAYMRKLIIIVQRMACRLVGAKSLAEPMLEYC